MAENETEEGFSLGQHELSKLRKKAAKAAKVVVVEDPKGKAKEYLEQKIRLEFRLNKQEAEGFALAQETRKTVEYMMKVEPDLMIKPTDPTKTERLVEISEFPDGQEAFQRFFRWQKKTATKGGVHYILNFTVTLKKEHVLPRSNVIEHFRANYRNMKFLYANKAYLIVHTHDSHLLGTAGFITHLITSTTNIPDLEKRLMIQIKKSLAKNDDEDAEMTTPAADENPDKNNDDNKNDDSKDDDTKDDGNEEDGNIPSIEIGTQVIAHNFADNNGEEKSTAALVFAVKTTRANCNKLAELIMKSSPSVNTTGRFMPRDLRDSDPELYVDMIRSHNAYVNEAEIITIYGMHPDVANSEITDDNGDHTELTLREFIESKGPIFSLEPTDKNHLTGRWLAVTTKEYKQQAIDLIDGLLIPMAKQTTAYKVERGDQFPAEIGLVYKRRQTAAANSYLAAARSAIPVTTPDNTNNELVQIKRQRTKAPPINFSLQNREIAVPSASASVGSTKRPSTSPANRPPPSPSHSVWSALSGSRGVTERSDAQTVMSQMSKLSEKVKEQENTIAKLTQRLIEMDDRDKAREKAAADQAQLNAATAAILLEVAKKLGIEIPIPNIVPPTPAPATEKPTQTPVMPQKNPYRKTNDNNNNDEIQALADGMNCDNRKRTVSDRIAATQTPSIQTDDIDDQALVAAHDAALAQINPVTINPVTPSPNATPQYNDAVWGADDTIADGTNKQSKQNQNSSSLVAAVNAAKVAVAEVNTDVMDEDENSPPGQLTNSPSMDTQPIQNTNGDPAMTTLGGAS